MKDLEVLEQRLKDIKAEQRELYDNYMRFPNRPYDKIQRWEELRREFHNVKININQIKMRELNHH